MDEKLRKKLSNFFLIFGAKHNLAEFEIEKIERALHQLHPKNIKKVEEICNFILENNLIEEPNEIFLEKLKGKFLS